MQLRGLLLACLLLFLTRLSYAQEAEYSIEQYTSIRGLPQNSVKSLDTDSSGFIWFTTEGGLVRYDGRHFKVFNHSSFSTINGDRFQFLFHDYYGNLSATNNSGSLVLIKNSVPELVPNTSYPLKNYFYFQGALPDYRQYYELNYKRQNIIHENWYSYPSTVFPLNNKEFLTINSKSFLRYNNKMLLTDSIVTQAYLPTNSFMIDSLIYFIDSSGTVNRVKPESSKYSPCVFIDENYQSGNKFSSVKILWNYRDDIAFCIKENVLYELSKSIGGDTIYCKKILVGMPENCRITAILNQKSTNSYFVGTDTRGLFVFKKKIVINLPLSHTGLTENGAYYSQVAIDSNHVFTTYGLVIGIDSAYNIDPRVFNVEGLHISKDHKIYFSKGDTIRYLKDKVQYKLNERSGGGLCFLEEGDSIITGTGFGFYSIKNNTIRNLIQFKVTDISKNPIQIVRDKNKNIWSATCTGLFKYSPDLSTFSAIKSLDGICVRALYYYNDLLFIGTYGNGYYILKDNRVKKMPIDDKNLLAQIHSFYVDSKGYMWFSSNNGIFMSSVKEIIKNFNTNKNEVYYYLINQEDGIKNPEFNGGCSPSVVRLKNGYLSYPSLEGLVWINPDSISPLFPEDKIFFENIRINQHEVSRINELRLPADFKVFAFDIIVPYWGKAENLRIEYRLNGRNAGWEKIEPEEKRLRFTNLASGNYTLEVRIRKGFNSEDFYYNTLNFQVEEYFYEKTWVQILGLLIIIGLTLLGVRLYSLNIIRKNEQLERTISDRTAELKESNELLHENLIKLQQSEEKLSAALTLRDKLMSIISHDLVTPIRFITLSSRLARSEADANPKEELVQVLKEIETTTMRLHDNAQNVLHWIRFQSKGMQSIKSNVAIHDLVDEVISLYQPIAEAGGSVINNLTPEEDILITDPRILKIVIQNILNNAVKFTKQGTITISSKTQNKDYHLHISDTGPGFSETALENIRQIRNNLNFSAFSPNFTEDGTQLGYQIIFELLRFLSGDFIIYSTKDSGSSIEIVLYNCLQE